MKKLIGLISLFIFSSATAYADNIHQYKISITNATSHHVFTPVLIATHHKTVNLFTVGDVASDGLSLQAETGNPAVLLAETQARHGVIDTVIGGFTPYGQTTEYTITARKGSRLSLTTMLATTNDAFAALNNVSLPRKSVTYYAKAYDAGTENNNEDCAFIPGPPCSEASGNARDTDTAEGFITIHNGIHGHGSLNPKDLDWRGPVAIITITRLDD